MKSDTIYTKKLDKDIHFNDNLREILFEEKMVDLTGFSKKKLSSIMNKMDQNMQYTERYNSLDIIPEKVIEKYADENTYLFLSAYRFDAKQIHLKESKISKINYHDLYIGVIHKKNIVYEKISKKNRIKLKYKIKEVEVLIETTGLDSLYQSIIRINGINVSPNYSGLNMVVYNTLTGEVKAFNFPTYLEK